MLQVAQQQPVFSHFLDHHISVSFSPRHVCHSGTLKHICEPNTKESFAVRSGTLKDMLNKVNQFALCGQQRHVFQMEPQSRMPYVSEQGRNAEQGRNGCLLFLHCAFWKHELGYIALVCHTLTSSITTASTHNSTEYTPTKHAHIHHVAPQNRER